MKKDDLYKKALRADIDYAVELRRLFGKSAGDVRYTARGRGEPGSELRRLSDAKLAADEALFGGLHTVLKRKNQEGFAGGETLAVASGLGLVALLGYGLYKWLTAPKPAPKVSGTPWPFAPRVETAR